MNNAQCIMMHCFFSLNQIQAIRNCHIRRQPNISRQPQDGISHLPKANNSHREAIFRGNRIFINILFPQYSVRHPGNQQGELFGNMRLFSVQDAKTQVFRFQGIVVRRGHRLCFLHPVPDDGIRNLSALVKLYRETISPSVPWMWNLSRRPVGSSMPQSRLATIPLLYRSSAEVNRSICFSEN